MRFTLMIIVAGFLTLPSCNDSNSTEESPEPGSPVALYIKKCSACHGKDGKMRYVGAKDLTESELTKEEIIHQIVNGSRSMPRMGKYLTEKQIADIAQYTITLREKK